MKKRIKTPPKPNCHECTHRRSIPGDCHLRCNNAKAKVVLNPTGVRGGWANYPINFDPVWIDACDGFSDKPKHLKAPDAEFSSTQQLITLLRMFK